MSDALNYLVRVRPDAMGHYFRFLKETGKHLDPKTRCLISVITKVHAQTERGLRQYLLRALREGCTPMEIIDALLMAFPALGLAKIVWATDVILAMNIPGFDPDTMLGTPPQWHDITEIDAVVPGTVQRFTAGARSVFVYRNGRSYRVYDSRCPHQNTDITKLAIKGSELTCPKHGWAFDVPSGDCIRKGNTPLLLLDSRVRKGVLQGFW